MAKLSRHPVEIHTARPDKPGLEIRTCATHMCRLRFKAVQSTTLGWFNNVNSRVANTQLAAGNDKGPRCANSGPF